MPRLIALCGRAGSGKSTVADILAVRGFTQIAFADPIKRIAAELWGFSYGQLYGASELRNRPDPRYNGLTPRRACQHIGSEIGRALEPDIWVRLALREATKLLGAGESVVITDLRFPNEAAAVRRVGGTLWRTTHRGHCALDAVAAAHDSERHIETIEVDAIIPDGPLSDLPRAIDRLLSEVSSCLYECSG